MSAEPTTTESAPRESGAGHDEAGELEREPAEMGPVVGSPLSQALRLGALVGLVVLLGVTQGLSMVIVVVSIVVMIFLHELGHYVMARRAGMLVTEFFIGFGPRIWSFHRGETEYGIKAIPAGAYVRIIGMSNMEDVDPALEGRTYRQGTFSQRLGVAVAGSAMHFIIALVLLTIHFSTIGGPDRDRWQVAQVTPGSAADAAGVRAGDEILAIGPEQIDSFEQFREVIPAAGPGQTDLTVVRDGEQVLVPIELSTRAKVIGTVREDIDIIDNGERLVVASPRSDGIAEAAGVVGGSTLTSVNGVPVDSLDRLPAAVGLSDGGVVELGLVVEGAQRTAVVDLGSDVAVTEPGAFVGVGPMPVRVSESVPAAAVTSVQTFGEVTVASVTGIGRFLWPPNLFDFARDAVTGGSGDPVDTPTAAAATPSGMSETRPISIVGVAILGSDLSQENLANLLIFLASINIFIGIFNLFPLLPFDGGHVVIACYEKAQELRRRNRQRYLADVSRMAPVAYGVIGVLVVVGLLALFVDLTRGVSLS